MDYARDIHERTFDFACRIINLHRILSRRHFRTDRMLLTQLLRSGTSVGANLEEAKAAQSRPDFISKTRISLKEARETHYWLRLLERSDLVESNRIHPLVEEANEIVAILTSIVKKASTAKDASI